MASFPPPPPPPKRPGAPQNAFSQATGNPSNSRREETTGSSSFFPPPPGNNSHLPPTESLATMKLNNTSSLPPPPPMHMSQQPVQWYPAVQGNALPSPPSAPSSVVVATHQQQHRQPPPPPPSMPHPHAFHRGSTPTHQTQQQSHVPPPPPGPPQPPYPTQQLQHAPPAVAHGRYPNHQYAAPPATAPPSYYPPQPQQHHAPPPPSQPYPVQQPLPPPIHGRPVTNNGMMQQHAQDKPKLDASQIPRTPVFTRPQEGQESIPIYYPKEALYHNEARPPPAADSRFLTFDDGNAAPQLLRSTIYAIPRDRSIVRKSLDMGLLCTPLAIASQDHVPRQRVLPDGSLEEWRDAQRIPLVGIPDETSPPRCSRCHAYANPFWNNGICNFCGTRNSTSMQLPNMTTQYGTVEYEVGGPYITRSTPVQPIFLYALDATCPNLPVYVPMLAEIGKDIAIHYERQVDAGFAAAPPRIGCCLVGSFGIIIATLDKNGSVVLTVMSDVTEQPFAPLPLDLWTYDMSTQDGVQQWECLTQQLWDVWQPFLKQLDKKSSYGPNAFALSCGGAALSFLADALAPSGGRATLVTWRRPNFGVGAIRDREMMNTSLYTKEKTEYALFTPLQLQSGLTDKADLKAAKFYKELGTNCAKNRVCIDVLIHTPPAAVPFLDLATLGELCRITSGRVKWIRSRRWKEEMQEELRRPLLTFVGRDAVFKLRCSEGLQVKSYLSSTAPGVTVQNGIAESPELEMSIVDPSTCIAVALEHRVGGIRKDVKFVYFQSALLYTASSGKRRVRVTTLALKTTSLPADVFRSADFGAITSLMTRKTIAELWQPLSDIDMPLQKARVDITMQCVDILSNYRLHTTANSLPHGQLILPDRLQLLPLYCMSLLKSVMLRSSLPKRGSGVRAVKPSPTADERAHGLFHGSSVVPALTMLLVHPYVFPILDMEDGCGEWQIPEYTLASSEIEKAAAHAYIDLPSTVNPSITSLGDDGIYLIDDGFTVYVYLGKDVPSNVSGGMLLKDEDGNYSVSDSSDFGKQVHRLLWQMQTFCSVGEGSESSLRPTVAPVEVVIGSENHKDPLEERMMALMVDDSSSSEHDYVDFLVRVHKTVRSKTEGA